MSNSATSFCQKKFKSLDLSNSNTSFYKENLRASRVCRLESEIYLVTRRNCLFHFQLIFGNCTSSPSTSRLTWTCLILILSWLLTFIKETPYSTFCGRSQKQKATSWERKHIKIDGSLQRKSHAAQLYY
jgi:hypothetical protein